MFGFVYSGNVHCKAFAQIPSILQVMAACGRLALERIDELLQAKVGLGDITSRVHSA